MSMWRAKKLDHEAAKRELVRSVGLSARRALEHIDWIDQLEKQARDLEEQRTVHVLLAQSIRPFIEHPVVNEWSKQYTQEEYGTTRRFRMLLLRGFTRAGKTMFAENLFGEQHSLVVNCQGLETDVPSLRAFTRGQHKCIVFDEVKVEQVLNNKALFQAGKHTVELSQSKCGGFRYSIWPYQIAMVLCSNLFPVTQEEGLKSSEDEDWIKHNVVVVELKQNQTWYVRTKAELTAASAHAGA